MNRELLCCWPTYYIMPAEVLGHLQRAQIKSVLKLSITCRKKWKNGNGI